MMPLFMRRLLEEHIPESLLQKRLRRREGRCHLVLDHRDELLLSRLGIVCDGLGPKQVVALWDEVPGLAVGGWLVIDNLAMGTPALGGIRVQPGITPAEVHNLARGMTLKNAAADLPFGGGKAGVVADPEAPPAEHREVMRRFARLLRRYGDRYVPGPDVGSNDADMETVAVENGLEGAVSKPLAMGGNRIDELGAAAGGVVIALERLLEILPRLTVLPQFGRLRAPAPGEVTVLIQGFGAVGAHAARELARRLPAARVVGVSDREGALYDPGGLDVEGLFRRWKETGLVTRRFYEEFIRMRGASPGPKFSSDPDDLLRESAFAFIPAAPVFQYLGVLPHEAASQRVDRMGEWTLIVEGANTYSPDPNRKAARMRMEQAVFRQKGILIATDYLVNSGGVIFAAQERLIPTPPGIRIPPARLGDREAVRAWLEEHAGEFAQLSEKRLEAGIAFRERVIRRNMTELVDLLAASPDLLPCQAAERISVRRLAARESERTARDIMEPIPAVTVHAPLSEAASLIVEGRGNIVAVLEPDGTVAGVVTTWDITRAVSRGAGGEQRLDAVMTREVIAVPPSARIPEIVRELEQHRISAMPVVENGRVLGVVSSDLLAQRYLPQLLRAQEAAAALGPGARPSS